LKQIIANTRETKTSVLREKLGVKSNRMKGLMDALVKEGWLVRHKERSKGYELVATENQLSEWKD